MDINLTFGFGSICPNAPRFLSTGQARKRKPGKKIRAKNIAGHYGTEKLERGRKNKKEEQKKFPEARREGAALEC